MTIDFSETYDQENDTYYVTFKTGEPSYCLEVDDVWLLELGVFTNLPTGFRILNFHKNTVARFELKPTLTREVKKALEGSKRSLPTIRQRASAVKQALDKVLA